MKVLIVTFWDHINFANSKFTVFDEKGEITSVTYEGINETFAEADFLKENKVDVKISAFLPTTLSYILNDPPPDYTQLVSVLESEVKNTVPKVDYIHILPSEGEFKNHFHKERLGNFHFFFYNKLYEDLVKETPDVILLDLSRAFSYFQAYATSATQLAVENYVITTNKRDTLLIEFTNVNNILTPLFIKDFKKIDFYNYLTKNIKLSTAKGFSTQGKSELYGIGKSLELGFPLALFYLLKNVEKLISPEEFEKMILNSIKVNKSEKYEVIADFEAHVTAPYYFIGYHFVNQYRKLAEEEVTIDLLEKFYELFNEPQRNLISREIQILKDLSKIPKEEGEYLLDYLIKLGNTRLIDWLKGEINEEEREECEINEKEMYSHAGLGRKFTKIEVKEGKIVVKYTESCLDEILSWVKNIGKE
ncbi:hypothetical protein SJAV_19320 [Sulfurisphaera javensis]|uniref:CRISPR-associated protein n=1 Tax=Sulfurisphaera javensis TaxID=2049879 RepID=A0AAT9GT57_9CREN